MFLAFSGVSPADFEDFYQELGKRHGRAVRVTYFGATSRILFVKMVSGSHEAAHKAITISWIFQLHEMALINHCSFTGAISYDSANMNAAAKDGDDGLYPTGIRMREWHFPTLAVESAYSNSLKLARKDKDWWFDNSPVGNEREDVKAVVLIHAARDEFDTVNVELWHRGKRRPTRKSTIRLKEPLPDMDILPLDPSLWCWTGAVPMRIDFQDVFLRPKKNPKDQDLMLLSDAFVRMATDVREGRRVSSLFFFFPIAVLIKMDFHRGGNGHGYGTFRGSP